MNSLNSTLIEGNLVRDPKAETTPGGAKLCTFSVAVNRDFMSHGEKRSEVHYFDVEVWNKTAETCLEKLTKGSGVCIDGRLKQERWTDKDNVAHSRVKIVGEKVEIKARSSAPVAEKQKEAEPVQS